MTHRAEIDDLLAKRSKHEADPRFIGSTTQVFQPIGRRSYNTVGKAGTAEGARAF